jgi:hypothetical protein
VASGTAHDVRRQQPHNLACKATALASTALHRPLHTPVSIHSHNTAGRGREHAPLLGQWWKHWPLQHVTRQACPVRN